MNEDIFMGKWEQLKGRVKRQWGKITDDDLDRISGSREELMGLMRERYGWERERAETEWNNFLRDLD